MRFISEVDVEQAGLAWLAGAGWRAARGPDGQMPLTKLLPTELRMMGVKSTYGRASDG